ncbi:MAG: hypothetical protein KF744_07865 [Taibaiella sp.]|nr:hypothetical protein [Taibaiella sp.]
MNVNRQKDGLDALKMLGEVARVDAPPFLLTRIRQRVANVQQRVSGKWVVATALSMILIIAMNIYLVAGQRNNSRTETSHELAQAMNLLPQNSLYE